MRKTGIKKGFRQPMTHRSEWTNGNKDRALIQLLRVILCRLHNCGDNLQKLDDLVEFFEIKPEDNIQTRIDVLIKEKYITIDEHGYFKLTGREWT
jgi:hypothetical protein